MRPYQPTVNPNDVLEGTIQRGSNGLYWISQPISNINNNIRTWVLYDGVPDDVESDNYVVPPTSPNNRLPRTTALENLLNELNSSDIPSQNQTQPPRLTRTNALENLLNELNATEPQELRQLTRSPATYDLTNSDDGDFIDVLESTNVHPRTVRRDSGDNISYMSFSTDSVVDNQDEYSIYDDTESIIESNYDEDSDIYTNISSESDSIIDDKSELLSKCLNDSPVTLSNYDETDLNDLFVIYVANKQGKFTKGSCLRRDEMKNVLKSDLDTIPSYIMSIYKTPSSNRTDDLLTGMTGKPTGKIIVRIPTNQIYVTFGSLKRVLSTPNKEWYALPLYGGKARRVGNLAGIYGSSMNHGQVPGFQIYKLFTKRDIENSVVSEENPDDYPHVYQYDTMKSLFELVGDTPVNIFIHNILNELINTQIITLPNIPQRTSSLQWTSKRQRRYGNPPEEL
jgi:hypothetical protein